MTVTGHRVDAGPVAELQRAGVLRTKVGNVPVCVIWSDGHAYAVDDRCPHLGFPLHRGSVRDGVLTCHWHHARFDLASGCTFDPFADDVRAYPVEVVGDRVVVVEPAPSDPVAHLRRRLADGLEQQLTLVIAKAVLALLEAGEPVGSIVRSGLEFGTTYRETGWGSGLTVLAAMANLLPVLTPEDRPPALVHGLAFVARDTAGHAPRFALEPLGAGEVSLARLEGWYRRFLETRSEAAAERTLSSAIATQAADGAVESMMVAAATDHVFVDEGHVVDFTNKAFEMLDAVGASEAAHVLPTLVHQTAQARRHEEDSAWRHPDDLVSLVDEACSGLEERFDRGARARASGSFGDRQVTALAWALLADRPRPVVEAVSDAVADGATPEQLGRALAFAAALRIVRFHVQNDHADWNVVHHGFTYANALHQSLRRTPSTTSLRGVYHGAMKVYLDRFLNVPAARLPVHDADAGPGSLASLRACWDQQGGVDDAGRIVYRWVRGGGSVAAAAAALGHALLEEDAEFHWYQTVEATVRQARAWPEGSEEAALILAAGARFLAAHTPTRRELRQVVRIAERLRRGEVLYDEADVADDTARAVGADSRAGPT